MRVLVKEGESVLADLSFEEDEQIAVGSDATCAIHLPDARVSIRNLLITPAGNNTWSVESLDYSNPATLNRHPITSRAALNNDDEIELHGYLLKVYLDAAFQQHVKEREPEDIQLSAEELAKVKKFPLPPGSVVKRYFDPVTLPMEDLNRASRVTVHFAACRDIHELVDVSVQLLLKEFDARLAWVGLRRKPQGDLEAIGSRLPSGQTCDDTPMIELLKYRCIERRQYICVRKVREVPDIGSAMAVPLPAHNGTLGMLYVDRAPKAKRFQIPDLDLLSVMASQIASKLEILVSEKAQRSAAVSSIEASVVHEIQAQLDPKTGPDFKNLQLSAYSRSGQENPGDVYDVMKHPDTQISALMLGHVNATGARLALSIARLHSTFRVGFLHNDPPHALARTLNWLTYDEKDPSTVDVVFLLLDPASGKLKYTRGGKMGALIVNAKGEPRALQGFDAPAIGQVRNYEYISRMEQLAPGETLALYSRGVASSLNAQAERFGEKRFIQLVCDGFCQPPSTTLEDVTYELTTFFADGRHPDDITIVLLHRTGE